MIDSGMKNQHEKYPGLPIFCLYTILSTLFHISCSGHCLFEKHEGAGGIIGQEWVLCQR